MTIIRVPAAGSGGEGCDRVPRLISRGIVENLRERIIGKCLSLVRAAVITVASF
jgi:hypothetical protein